MPGKKNRIRVLEQKVLKRLEIDYGEYVVMSQEELFVLRNGDEESRKKIERKYRLDLTPNRKIYTHLASPDVWD